LEKKIALEVLNGGKCEVLNGGVRSFRLNANARSDMLGLCFVIGALADKKRREARERAQGPEGAPLVVRNAEGEARPAPDTAEEKES
jgi:hypothetical protein